MARTLSVGLEHEVLQHLEDAGLKSRMAQGLVASKDNGVALSLVGFLKTIMDNCFILENDFKEYNQNRGVEPWKAVTDTEQGDGLFMLEPELGIFHMQGQEFATGPELLQRANIFGNCGGHRHAEAMLRYIEKIPSEFDPYWLIFPDTIWEDSVGRRLVTGIRRNISGWYMHWQGLDRKFSIECRIIRVNYC